MKKKNNPLALPIPFTKDKAWLLEIKQEFGA